MPVVNPIHVKEGEVVDIHWHLKDGAVWVERIHNPPPKATRDSRDGKAT